MIDAIKLTQQLICCPSITPHDAGALDIIQHNLESLGFNCQRLVFENIDNLYARRGHSFPNFCFLGHTDVVPAGDLSGWKYPPFEAIIENGILYGRGAVDMKGAIAAFLAAVSKLASFNGSLSFLITGDEEGRGLYGTRRVLEWLHKKKEVIDFCLVGEPTSCQEIGDTLKIGRRGSLSGILTVLGTQGHVAYPEHFDNPIPRLIHTLNTLYQTIFDQGSTYFPPSHFEVVSIDTGHSAFNVVPACIEARFNIRFNDLHSSDSLMDTMKTICKDNAGAHKLDFFKTGEAFLTSSPDFGTKVQKILSTHTSRLPQLSTTGGTSDARFLHTLCPVVELGLKNLTAHQVNEQVPLEDLQKLTKLYQAILESF